MPLEKSTLAIFGSAVALRLALFYVFPNLPDLLTSRVEISTPVTSFKRCGYMNLCLGLFAEISL